LLKHEPSAQSPWQNTMLGFVFVILLSLVRCQAPLLIRLSHPSDQPREKYCLRPKTKPLNGMPSAP